MVLIALSGRKGAGKDTAFEVIKDWSARRGALAVRRGFADKLKLSAARIFNPDVELEEALVIANDLKLDGVYIEVVAEPEHGIATTLADCTGREFLQRFGTEAHRDVFGEDFWVDQLLPQVIGWQENFRPDPVLPELPAFAVITDCRFENEARRVKKLGGVVWEIDRPSDDEGDDHSSEKPLPRNLVDLTIVNDKTLDHFKASVNSEMTAEFHMQFLSHDPM
jgi:hypothetical protein